MACVRGTEVGFKHQIFGADEQIKHQIFGADEQISGRWQSDQLPITSIDRTRR
jgi:hypothetical protein